MVSDSSVEHAHHAVGFASVSSCTANLSREKSDDVLNANLGKNGCPADITTIDGSYPISDLNQGNTIDLLAYDVDASAWSYLVPTDLTDAAQITFGIDGEMYAIEAGGELSILDPEDGISYPPIGDPPDELDAISELM